MGREARNVEEQATHTHLESEGTAIARMSDPRVENHNAEWTKVVGRRRLEFRKADTGGTFRLLFRGFLVRKP